MVTNKSKFYDDKEIKNTFWSPNMHLNLYLFTRGPNLYRPTFMTFYKHLNNCIIVIANIHPNFELLP